MPLWGHRGRDNPFNDSETYPFIKGQHDVVLSNVDSGAGWLVFKSSSAIYWVCNFGQVI